MVEHYRSYDPDIDGYDDDVTDHRIPPYRFGHSAQTGNPENSVPLFLSDASGEPDPSEYMPLPRNNPRAPISARRSVRISSKILAGVLASAALAILVALFSSDAAHFVIANARASISAILPASSAAAQPENTRLTPTDALLKDPTRLAAPANQTPGARTVTTVAVASPTRSEITNAYQSALQGRAPAAATPAATPPARKLDTDELATLLNRAKGLLAAGDIPPARLLLERAADAQDHSAALMLAQTYDPDVLGTQDIRNITAEPATARAWYQRAAQLGSAAAQRRLSQLQN